MKAALTFDLPENRGEFKVAAASMDWALTVWDMAEKLRAWLDHGHDFKTADDALQGARDFLYNIMSERGVSLDDIF